MMITQKLDASEETDMLTENEQIVMLIDKYVNLQRIKSADDVEKEIDYQIEIVKAMLKNSGFSIEKLSII